MKQRRIIVWIIFVALLVLAGLWSLSALAGCSSTVGNESPAVSTTTTTTTSINFTTTANLTTSSTTTTTYVLLGLSGRVSFLPDPNADDLSAVSVGLWTSEAVMDQPPSFIQMHGITSSLSYIDYAFTPFAALVPGTYYIAAFLTHEFDAGKFPIVTAGDKAGQYSDGKLSLALGGTTSAQPVVFDGQNGVSGLDFSLNGDITTGTTITLVTTTTTPTTTTTMIPPGGAFSLYSIDNNEDVGRAALALDDNNYAHVSYYDATHKTLRYADNVSGSWSSAVVDSSSSDIGKYSAIAFAPNGTIYISYCDSANGRLKLASRPSGGSWSIETIEDSGISEGVEGNSIAADINNKVHISYYHKAAGSLKYANNLSGGWVIATVDAGSKGTSVGRANSIALDRSTAGRVHVAYTDDTFNVKYVTNRSGSWAAPVVVDINSTTAGSNSLAIDSGNNAQMIYNQISAYSSKLASNATGSWVKSFLFGSMNGGEHIAIDSNDRAQICYMGYSGSDDAVKYATNTSGSWESYDVELFGIPFGIAVDKNNKPHIIYTLYDSGSGNRYLKYATNK